MNETPEMIRKQMGQNKLQLALKLQALEHHVSTTVHSTEAAVTETMETVQTVTGDVRHAVDAVAKLLDVTRHIQKHPWMVVGGAGFVGYLAAAFLTSRPSESVSGTDAATISTVNSINGKPIAAPLTHTALNLLGHSAGTASSPWDRLKDAAIGSLFEIVRQTISRMTPIVVDRLIEGLSQSEREYFSTVAESEFAGETSQVESHRLRIANSETLRP